jgi:hypothetical protein
MKNPQFTIAGLILVIVIAAIGLAAVRSGSPAWAGAMLSITFFAMISSLLGVALCRGQRRVYWLGFAVLGWSYLFLMYAPWLHGNAGRFLLAPNLFEYLDEVLHPEPAAGGGMQSVPVELLGATATGGGFGGNVASSSVQDFSAFVRIGMAMEALLWAFLGGWAACHFASGRDNELIVPVSSESRTGVTTAGENHPTDEPSAAAGSG